MTSYLVKWESNIHANSPSEAAEKGLLLLRAGVGEHQLFKVIAYAQASGRTNML